VSSRNPEQFRLVAARVQNFGCFHDSTEVKIEDINVLIAENENGKTTFLRSLAWWSQPDVPFDEEDRWDGADKKEVLDLVSLTFEVPTSLALKLRSSEASKFPDRVRITRRSDSSYRVENAHDGLAIDRNQVSQLPEDYRENLQGLVELLSPYRTQPEVKIVYDDLKNSAEGLRLSQESGQLLQDDFPNRFPGEMYSKIASAIASLTSRPVNVVPVSKAVDFQLVEPLIPRIMYFDETVEYLEDSVTYDVAASDPVKHRTMINLAKIAGFDLLSVKGSPSHDRLVKGKNAEKAISSQFNKYWQGADVNLLIHLDETQMTLMIDYKGRTQRPSRRSSGLKWQLGFYINFEADCGDELSTAVLLLDEPGLRLHIKQQPKLLDLFKKLARDGNIIMYSTHLGNMLLADKPHSYRLLVQDASIERAVQIQSDIRKIRSSNDVFEPVRQALGMGIANSIGLGHASLLVEGLSDLYILSSMSELSRRAASSYLNSDISVVPIGGSGGKSLPIVAFAISESASVVVLVDDDPAGISTQKAIASRFRDTVTTLRTHRESKTSDRELEDLFECAFYLRLVNESHAFLEDFDPIHVEDLRADVSICDAIQENFVKQGLGTFQKLRPALHLQMLMETETFPTENLGEFPNLFSDIEASFRNNERIPLDNSTDK